MRYGKRSLFTNAIETEICTSCNGSGEGLYDGKKCDVCFGSGEVPVNKDFIRSRLDELEVEKIINDNYYFIAI